MKTLANCTDVEFLRQTNKIRKYAEAWLKNTGVLEIRRRELPTPDESLSEEAKKAAYRQSAMQRLNDMLDTALDTHAEETARLLRMMCFVDENDAEALKMPTIIKAVSEIMADEDVLDFFISLRRLGQKSTETPAQTSGSTS